MINPEDFLIHLSPHHITVSVAVKKNELNPVILGTTGKTC